MDRSGRPDGQRLPGPQPPAEAGAGRQADPGLAEQSRQPAHRKHRDDTRSLRLWNGSGFGAADTLPGTFENCLPFSLAYGSNGAMLAYTRDMDGDLAPTLDQEIFSNAFDGSAWSGAVRLTDDTVADVNPQVLYRSDGSRELVWRRGTDLVRRTNWDTGSTEAIRTGCDSVTFADFRAAITTPDDRLILYWQGSIPWGIDSFTGVRRTEHLLER
jgi:hypothetical protein